MPQGSSSNAVFGQQVTLAHRVRVDVTRRLSVTELAERGHYPGCSRRKGHRGGD